jgi:PPOX class probable F420-dependent enzyme
MPVVAAIPAWWHRGPLPDRAKAWQGEPMDIPQALEYVRGHHRAVLATTRSDGSPQLSPVSVVVDAASRIAISTRQTAVKLRNLRRDPRAWVCVFDDGFFGPWVQLGGSVEILSLPDALEPLVDYYRAAAGEHPDWDEYRATMVRDQRCLVLITPTEAGPNVSG